jgi:hypothetical protein
MRKLTALALVALALVAIGYRATHTPIYGNCHTTADGRVCTLLKWEANK